MPGIIGKKIGMTSLFTPDGKNIPCTLIEAGPCVVTQVKTIEKDGYTAIQLGYGEKKAKNTTKALAGHFAKAGTTPKRKLVEFRLDAESTYAAGAEINASSFAEGEFVDVSSQTLISTSTPLGNSSFMRASTVFDEVE